VGVEGETKVGLGKGRGDGAERTGKSISISLRNMNGEEGCFMIVDCKTGGTLEELKDLFSS
jgi:hypothetical protein